MNPVTYMHLISIAACLAAAFFMLSGWKRGRVLTSIPILLLTLLALMIFYQIALFLEWSEMADWFRWHYVEDFAGVFIPFLWAFVFYAAAKNTAEINLREIGKHYRDLVEGTTDWIWEVDTQGRYTYASRRVQRILGYTPDEILGKTPFDLMPPDEAKRARKVYSEVMDSKSSFQHLENVSLHKDGHEVILETNGVPIFDAKGKLTGYRGIDRDITDRLRAEQQTRQYQAELDSVFRASPVGVGLVRERKLCRVNDRFAEIVGYAPEQLIGADPRMCYQTDQEYRAVGEKYKEALIKGYAYIETRWMQQDHSLVDVIAYIAPLDAADEDAGFVIVVQDITEIKAARQQVLEEKNRAQLYLDVAGAILLVLDPKGRIQMLNKKGCELLGCSIDKVMGSDWYKNFVSGSHRAIAQNTFNRILMGEEKAVEHFEYPIISLDGSEKFIAWHNAIIRDESGTITGVISSGEDVTEIRETENAKRQSDEQLRIALSAAQMGTWRWEAATRKDTFDVSLKALLGLTADESIEDVDFFDYAHPDDRDVAKNEFDRAICEHDTYIARYRVIRSDGQIRWILDQGMPFYDFNGKLEYVTGVVVDITERQKALIALKESEQRFQAAANYTYDWETWISPKGKVVWINPAVQRISGYTVEECLQMDDYPLPIVYEEDRDLVSGMMKEALEETTGNDREFRIKEKDGSIRWVAISWQPIYDQQEQSLGYRTSIRDISERKEAEEQIRQSRDSLQREIERFENMFHTIPDCIYIKDLQSRFTHLNEAWLKRVNLTDEQEVLGKTDFDIFTEEHARPAYEDEQEIMRTGIPKVGYEEKETWPDGSTTWCLSTKMPLRDIQGNIVGLIGISHDITDRMEVEQQREELMQQLQFTQFAVDHTGEAAYWMKSDGSLFYVNKAACQSLGYTRDELLAMTVFDIDPDFGPEKWADAWESTRTHGTYWAETHHKTKDGRIFPVEVNGNFVVYDGKEYSCAFARDITDRKAAEQHRRIMHEQLESRNDELQSIVFATAHDLRSPLVNITGFSGELEKSISQLQGLLKGEKLSPKTKEQIDVLFGSDIPESLRFIRSGNQRMDALLNAILQLSRVGSVAIKSESIDMNDLLERVLDDLQYRIHEEGFNVMIPPDLLDCVGDFSLLDQVFTNLLDNAIKYRHPERRGMVKISAELQGDIVEYRVADNGIGIEPEQLDKVFDLFHQLDVSSQTDGEGLGLTIVRRILDRLGGTVRIESTPGLGTTIYMKLPKT